MAWTMEQAYPISLDVVLCVNLILFILFYFIFVKVYGAVVVMVMCCILKLLK